MIHEAESCTIVYYRRERGRGSGRRGRLGRQRPSLKPTHPLPPFRPTFPSPRSLSGCHECRGLARAFNVSTESEPMTGRNRDAETMLPFSHLDESPSPPPSLLPFIPPWPPRHYRADSGSTMLASAHAIFAFLSLAFHRRSSIFFDYLYFRSSVTSGIDNGYH